MKILIICAITLTLTGCSILSPKGNKHQYLAEKCIKDLIELGIPVQLASETCLEIYTNPSIEFNRIL